MSEVSATASAGYGMSSTSGVLQPQRPQQYMVHNRGPSSAASDHDARPSIDGGMSSMYAPSQGGGTRSTSPPYTYVPQHQRSLSSESEGSAYGNGHGGLAHGTYNAGGGMVPLRMVHEQEERYTDNPPSRGGPFADNQRASMVEMFEEDDRGERDPFVGGVVPAGEGRGVIVHEDGGSVRNMRAGTPAGGSGTVLPGYWDENARRP